MRTIAIVLGLAATFGVGLAAGGGLAWSAAIAQEREAARADFEASRVEAERKHEAAFAELRAEHDEARRQFEQRVATFDAKHFELAAQVEAMRAEASATETKSRGKSATAKDGLRDLTELVRDVDELGKAIKDVTGTVRQIRRKE